MYRRIGEPRRAIEVLKPVIETYPDEFRAFLEYAHCHLDAGESIKTAAGILGLSTVYGYGDMRYLATHAGLLFLDERFTDADNVFRAGSKRDFSTSDLHKTWLYPDHQGKPLRMSGKVVAIRRNHFLIESGTFPQFMCRQMYVKDKTLEVGAHVTFQVAFTGMSSIALDPAVVAAPDAKTQPRLTLQRA